MGIVNRSLLVALLALSAVAALGAVYGRLTAAAPAAAPVAAAAAVTATFARAAPAPLESAAPAALVSASPEVLRLEARRQLYESVDALVQASEFEKARKL